MKVIISAGGTGGHIYPALAIINTLKEKEKNLEILYIGTHNRMEKDIIPKNNIPYESIEIYGFSKNIIRDFKNLFLIQKATNKCLKIMRKFKPDIVIGVGGYVTYPVIKAASKLGIKTIIHEQNSIPGKSNRFLAKKVDKIAVSFPGSKHYFPEEKVVVTGNPCATNALKMPRISKSEYGLKLTKKLVVIVAGSLGSKTINDKMIDFLYMCANKDFEILYITGKAYYEEFNKNKFSNNVHIKPYIDNLPSLLKSTDLIITRAGASTISEIIALQIPAIFIPSPYVANNHQYYNAIELKENMACDMIEENNLSAKLLMEKTEEILYNSNTVNLMKENLKKLSCHDSGEKIYNVIKELTK